MSRRFEYAQSQITESKDITVFHSLTVTESERAAVIDCSASTPREIQGTDKIVFVAVGFEDMRNSGRFALRYLEVCLDITTRINDCRCTAVADDIRKVRNTF